MKKTRRTLLTTGLCLGLAACSSEPAAEGDAGGDAGTGQTDSGGGGDRTPPTLSRMSPADGAGQVPRNAMVEATFSEPIDCARVQPTTLVLSAGGPVAGQLTCAGSSLRFLPAAALLPMVEHTITVLPEVRDLAGNGLLATITSRFTTGDTTDTTPPADPALTSPSPVPATTMEATLAGSGSKEADSGVEARWLVDGVMQHDFQSIAAIDPNTGWSHAFPLLDGLNVYELRAVDAAGLYSCAAACPRFMLTKEPGMMTMVPVPTVSFVSPTGAERQVISGSKAAGTGVELDGRVVVPPGASTTWDLELRLSPGANSFSLRARDATGNTSSPVPVDIQYTRPADIPAAAQLRVQLELSDLWNEVGDEYRITNVQREIGHYSVNIWLEGPLTVLSDGGTPQDPSDDRYEPCYYDRATYQRKYTRFATMLNFTASYDAPNNRWLAGHWWEPNHFVPNLFAAWVEAGAWANAARPISPTVDRRDAQGGTHFWSPGGGACPPSWFQLANGNCKPIMADVAPVDVISEASINPGFDTQGTAAQGNQQPVGSWRSGLLTYPRRPGDDAQGSRPRLKTTGRGFSWTNLQNQPLPQGAYLLSVMLVLDRSAPAQGPGMGTAPYQWLDVLRTDRETCWDDPAHDREGSHRAEGVIQLGAGGFVSFLAEKGPVDEVVDACHNIRAGLRCSGNDLCDWNGDGNFGNDPSCPAPSSNVGASVRYLVPQSGWSAPVRVEYCPAGCP